jgi:hypothetical protein
MSDMDGRDYRVECLRCTHPSRGRLVMRWKTAVITHSFISFIWA